MITLILGPESYVAKTTLEQINTTLTAEGMGLEVIEMGSKAKLGEFQAATQMISLLGGSKLVIARDWVSGSKTVDAEDLESYLRRVPDEVNLVFIESALDKRLKLTKVLMELAKVIPAPPLNAAEAQKFAIQFAQAQGIQLDSALAAFLVDRIGTSQWQIHQEILKLGAHAGENSITRDQIVLLTPVNYEEANFALIDAIVAGQSGLALQLLQTSIASGMHELQIFRSLTNHYRRLLYMRLRMDEGVQTTEPIVKEMKTHPFAASKVLAQARLQKSANVMARYWQLGQLDQDIKKGQIDADLALTLFVLGGAASSRA